MHEPRHAARHGQLGNADHRAARSRAQPAHDAAAARLGDPRVHDRLDRARAHGGTALRPVRPQDGIRPRLPRLLPRLARRRVRRQRHRADPLARPAGCRRRVPVRERRRARHGRVPAARARARDGDEHDGRGGRARDRTGARRRARRDRLAVGLLVQRPARPARLRLGRARARRTLRAQQGARARPARRDDLRRRA